MRGRLIALSLVTLFGVGVSTTLAGPPESDAATHGTRVPPLTNVRVELAVERLTGAGLCPGDVRMHRTAGRRGDVVLRQSPKAGTTLARQSRVDIDVAVAGSNFTYATPPDCPLPS